MTFDLQLFLSSINWGACAIAFFGPTGLAYLLILKYGEKWIDRRVEAKTKRLEHDLQKELDRARDELQRMFDRVVKIHAKEFEVLPEAWLMLHELHGKAYHGVDAVMKGVPAFGKMKDDELEEFLKQCSFTDFQRKMISEAETPEQREKEYFRLLNGNNLDVANEAGRLFKNYLLKNDVFMTPEIGRLFHSAHETIQHGVTQYQIGKDHDYKMQHEGIMKVLEFKPTFTIIKDTIQKRLGFVAVT